MTHPPMVSRADVAATARMVVSAGLVEAFGHVSARTPAGFFITSTRPLAATTANDVIEIEGGIPVGGPVGELPLEMPMHDAIYRARSDVAAICRGHPPFTVAWGVTSERLPLLHGLGGMAGGMVRVHPDIRLVKSREAGDAVARTLGDNSGLLLQSNGCLTVGADLLEAATRLWYLEERARVVIQARSARIGMVETPGRVWRSRLADSGAELIRAKQWMLKTYGTAPPKEE